MQPKNLYCVTSKIEKTGQLYSCFKIGPFFQNHGLTFANSLRRILLIDQSKCAVQAVQIYNIEHEFSTLSGLRESIGEVLFNLKKCIFQTQKTVTKPQIGFLNFCGPGIIRAQHIHLPFVIQCANPSQYITTLETDGQLTVKLFFSFNLFKNEIVGIKENFIYLKNSFCSIEKVNYTIPSEKYLFFEIWTDGSLHPQKAIFKAINELVLSILPFTLQSVTCDFMSFQHSTSFQNSIFLNLEIGNFYFDLETYIFLKKKKVNRIIDFLFLLKKKDYPKFQSIRKFRIFIYSFLQQYFSKKNKTYLTIK